MKITDLSEVLLRRAQRCVRVAAPHLDAGEYFIGGGAIAGDEPRDIDIYPAGDAPFTVPTSFVIVATKNAATIRHDPPLQFCSYKKPTLEALVDSFDFAHIQCGVHIVAGKAHRAYWTEDFIATRAARTSEFTGSEYPLASLVRLPKYYRREELTRNSAIRATLDILAAILERGFKDYEDFKDQLDAVDLGLIPDDLDEVSKARLMTIFDRLKR